MSTANLTNDSEPKADAFISAFATMAFLMNFLKKASMMVFVVYRVGLGMALLAFF